MTNHLPYVWDLNWDVKTVTAARKLYAEKKKKLAQLPLEITLMEQLAAQTGFKLEE